MRRVLRLSGALSVAAVAGWLQPSTAWRKIWAALTAWRHYQGDGDFWQTYRRYRCCRKCPLFYAPLRTCGSPLVKDLRGLGCYCNMEAKAPIENAVCWLDENGIERDFSWSNHGGYKTAQDPTAGTVA